MSESRRGRVRRTAALAWLILPALLLVSAEAEAQIGRQAATKRELFIDVDELGEELLRRAEEYRKIGDWAPAVQLYDKILTDAKYASLLHKDKTTKVIRSLRARVRDILRELPPEGLHAYRLLRRVDAEREFKAGEAGEPAALRRLLQRYPATAPAGKAACRLAALELTLGRIGPALTAARQALRDYRSELSTDDLAQAVRIACFAEALGRRPDRVTAVLESVEDLDAELKATLSQRASDLYKALPESGFGEAPRAEGLIWRHGLEEYYADSESDKLPRSAPVVLGEAVIFHNDSYARALNLRDGKLLWRTALKPGAEEFKAPADTCRIAVGASRLFMSVEHARLVAVEGRTGRIAWQKTPEQLRRETGAPGPLWLSSRLVTGHGTVLVPALSVGDNRDFRVLAFDGLSGKLVWNTLICSVRAGNDGGGFSLIEASGRIFALTGDGVLACLNTIDGSLTWLREISSGGALQRRPVLALSGGRLICAPPETNAVLAVDPFDGRVVARGKNKGGPAILGVYRGTFVRLYRNGHLRHGPGGKRLVAKLGKGLRPVAPPIREGRFLTIPEAERLRIIDLDKGEVTVVKTIAGADQRGRLLTAGGRLVVVGAGSVSALGPAAGLTKPDWPGSDKARDPAFLIDRLASGSWREREAATEALIALGDKTLASLDKRPAPSADPEVARRVGDIRFELSREAQKARWREQIRPEWEAAVPGILDLLTHRNPRVRFEALERLGTIEDEDIEVLFKDLLTDRSPRIALKAARLLYLRGDRAGAEVFRRTLEKGSEAARLEVLQTLDSRKTRRDRAKDLPLARLALKDEGAGVRAFAVRLVTALGDRQALPELGRSLGDPAAEVRVAAIQSIGNLGLDAGGKLLAPLVKDKNEWVRSEVVKALTNIESEPAVRALCKALLDAKALIARTAADALVAVAEGPYSQRIPDDEIEKGLDARDADVRAKVVWILRQRVERPISLLTRLALDPNPAIHTPALDEIFNRISARDIKHVERLIKAKNVNVRFAATQIIGEIPGRRADKALLALLEDKDEQVRDKAASVLGLRAHPLTVLDVLEQSVRADAALAEAKTKLAAAEAAARALGIDPAKAGADDTARPGDSDGETGGEKSKADKPARPRKAPGAAEVKRAVARAELKRARHAHDQALRQASGLESMIRGMDAEVEAPGLIMALDSKTLGVRKLAIRDLEAIDGVTREYVADAPADKRAPSVKLWRAWYFEFKAGAALETIRANLAAKAPNDRLEAAKSLAHAWSREQALAIADALGKESVPWLAVELDKVLSGMTGEDRKLSKTPSVEARAAAAKAWRAALPESWPFVEPGSGAADSAPDKAPESDSKAESGSAKPSSTDSAADSTTPAPSDAPGD